ncbi:MAG: HesA/MoeB/ThiF family protein [Syntrophomonadaceae bacterium]|jgi:molybdopterin/thiamine biosynthesis adenylyltransferase|nr:HesA/MoeB/ThiF family protein [Syntrophomonadaceae bacterium]
MEKKLQELIKDQFKGLSLTQKDEMKLAASSGCSLLEVQAVAMDLGVVPLRYQRNLESLTLAEQRRLLQSRVTVVGCGGLGGLVLEELARIGVGQISAWDYDCFEEHNLNRQFMSQADIIGFSKVEAAAHRVHSVNPGIVFNGIKRKFTADEGRESLQDQQVVVDALDSAQARLGLSQACRDQGIPLVHGAVNGWYGQVATQFPGDFTIEQLYLGRTPGEEDQSALVFAAAMVASWQVSEVIKIILNKGNFLRQKIMLIDMLSLSLDIIDF